VTTMTRSSSPEPVTAVTDLASAWLPARMTEVERRLGETVAGWGPELGSDTGETLAAGGKRMRPLLVLLCAGRAAGTEAIRAATAIELVHMATLVHDDLIDGAAVRRGRASAWSEHGAEAAKASGDYLFASAFSVLAQTRDPNAVAVLADASLALARGEAMQRRQRHDPDTTVDDYLERCSLKTGKLFDAACTLGGGAGEYGRLLGIAFQIADDVLDCTGETIETGKVPGTDLRDGTPTLPLLLAAQQDQVVRAALVGGPKEGALVRVAATDALDRSRELALHYASEARSCLDGAPRREELEALTWAVVERRS
jgi:geranylgeranyl pyrophosphate synthase